MINVHLCGTANSTIFTNCCNVAILDHQATCPGCGGEVYPGYQASTHERGVTRWNWAYGPQRRDMEARNKAMRS